MGLVNYICCSLSTVFPEEEVVLEGKGGCSLGAEEALVVAVIDNGYTLDGVVLKDKTSNLDSIYCIKTYEGTETIPDCAVDKLHGSNLGGFTDVEAVTAATKDIVNLARVECNLTDG